MVNRLFAFAMKAVRKISKDRISVYAAQATLFIIISAIPFLMLGISLLKFLLPFTQSELVIYIKRFLPQQIVPFGSSVIDELYSGNTIPVVSVTSVTTMWSASKGIMSLLTGLDNIYGLKRSYIKARILSIFYTIIFLLLICATLVLFAFGEYIMQAAASSDSVIFKTIISLKKFPFPVYFIVMTFIFALLYKLLPGQKISFLYQLPGAALVSAGWLIYSSLYSFYVTHYAHYSFLYGSLAAIVFLMLWLYFCMNLFLCGAEFNVYLKRKKYEET